MPCSMATGVRVGHQTTAAGTRAQCWEPDKCETATEDGLLIPHPEMIRATTWFNGPFKACLLVKTKMLAVRNNGVKGAPSPCQGASEGGSATACTFPGCGHLQRRISHSSKHPALKGCCWRQLPYSQGSSPEWALATALGGAKPLAGLGQAVAWCWILAGLPKSGFCLQRAKGNVGNARRGCGTGGQG